MSNNISNISKDSKIHENMLFVPEIKDASEHINILAYLFYYHHPIIQEAVQKDEYNTEKLNRLLYHSSQKSLMRI